MSKSNQELLERAIKMINQDIEIYQKLNTVQFDKGLDFFEIYSECYDISNAINNSIQRIINNIDEESDKDNKDNQKSDGIIQLQFFLIQIENQQQTDTRCQNIIAITKKLVAFLERNQEFNNKFKIQRDQLNYLRIIYNDPQCTNALKSGLNLLTEWLVAMCYKFKINKKIDFITKTLPRVQYQANVVLEFFLSQEDQISKNNQVGQQKITESFLSDQQEIAEILSDGFVLQQLTSSLIGSIQGGFCSIGEWVQGVIQASNQNFNQLQNTQEKIKK
ncbi:unnamed protein product [Paramecium sonneborni]|uniref:Uncharacterized protein n=1 Tax=Paramecium sonneborni TaxID=65129 RepID=A0A8S1LHZ7_9CILI|nr:unnamed protein product [Paramecium sonneborni]